MEEKDKGFTLIELLVVIIIIGILSAIAIPIFLNQRKKAVDTAARADVATVAKQVATYLVDNDTVPILAVAAGSYTLSFAGDTDTSDDVIGPVSGGFSEDPSIVFAGTDAADFTVTLTFSGGTEGDDATIAYAAATGLGEIQAAGE
ncbi:prepilin-type N-terminal cleavage/methylation domain-containing protein [Cellulomonas hominis]